MSRFTNSINRFNQNPRWIVALIVSLLPVIATLLLVRFYLNTDFSNFVPLSFTDQKWYWHQTSSFSQVGFNSGYYSVNEGTATLKFFKYSSAGPLFPVLYGFIGHFTGWGWLTGVIISMVFLTLAILAFIYLAQLDNLQILITGIVLLVSGPVLIFLTTYSQETFHQSVAIVLAGLFYRLWQGKMSRRLWWIGLLFLLFVSPFRISWVIFLPFYFLIGEKKSSIQRIIYSFLIGGLLAVGVYLVVSFTSSPDHNSFVQVLASFRYTPWEAFKNLLKLTHENMVASFIGTFPIQDIYGSHAQGVQIAIIFFSALVLAFPSAALRGRTNTRPLENIFHVYNFGVIFLLGIVLYNPGGFYRVFGVHVLLSLLLLIAFRRFTTINLIIAVSILFIGTTARDYRGHALPNLNADRPALEAVRQKWEALIPYQPDADPWCNTILFPLSLVQKDILLVPSRIGIGFYYGTPPPNPKRLLRSLYIFLDQPSFDYLNTGTIHLQPIAKINGGTLYRNLDAPCTPST